MKTYILTIILLISCCTTFSQKISKEGKEIIKLNKKGTFNNLRGELKNSCYQVLKDGDIYISYVKSENKFVIILNLGNKPNANCFYVEAKSVDLSIIKCLKYKDGKLKDLSILSFKELFNEAGIGFSYTNYAVHLTDLLEFISNPQDSEFPNKYCSSVATGYNFSYYNNPFSLEQELRIHGSNCSAWFDLIIEDNPLVYPSDVLKFLQQFQRNIYSKVDGTKLARYNNEATKLAINGNDNMAKYYYEHIFGFLDDSLYNKNLKYEFDKNALIEIAYLYRGNSSMEKKYMLKSINAGQYANIFDFRDRVEEKEGGNYTKGLAYQANSYIEDAIWNYEFKKQLIEKKILAINPTLDSILKNNGKNKIIVYQNPNIYNSFFKDKAKMSYLFMHGEVNSLQSFSENNYDIFFIDEFSPLRGLISNKYSIKPDLLRSMIFLDPNGNTRKTIEHNNFSDFILFQDECLKSIIQYNDYEKLKTNKIYNLFTGLQKEFMSCDYSEATINTTLPAVVLNNPNLGFHRDFGYLRKDTITSLFYSSPFADILGVEIKGIGIANSVKNINYGTRGSGYSTEVKTKGEVYSVMSDREVRDFWKSDKQLEAEQKWRDQNSYGIDWTSNKREVVDNRTKWYEYYYDLYVFFENEPFISFKMYDYYSRDPSGKLFGIQTFTNSKNNTKWILDYNRWIARPIYYTMRNRGCRIFSKTDIENMKKNELRLYKEVILSYDANKLNMAFQKADSLLYFNEITSFYEKSSNEIINMHIVVANILFNYAKFGIASQKELSVAAYKSFAHFAFLSNVGNVGIKNQSRINMAFILAHEKDFFNDFLTILPSELDLKVDDRKYTDTILPELEKRTSPIKLY